MTKEQKQKKAEYDREYRKLNREKIAARKKKWYEDHKDQKREYDKQYRSEHIEERKKYKKVWNKRKKKETKEYNKEYYSTLEGLAKRRRNHYLYEDKLYKRTPENCVSSEWIVENILTNKECVYCGEDDYRRLGCDRIDDSIGHQSDNIVCACQVCNWERSLLRMSVEEFKEYRKTHPRFKETLFDEKSRLTGEKVPLKKKIPKTLAWYLSLDIPNAKNHEK